MAGFANRKLIYNNEGPAIAGLKEGDSLLIYPDYTALAKEIKEIMPILPTFQELYPDHQLIKKGGKWWASCVNRGHLDEHPSCLIDESRNAFHCFVCGTHLDSIALYAQRYNITNGEAIKRRSIELGLIGEPTPEEIIVIKQKRRKEQQDRRCEGTAKAIIKQEYIRLCTLERTVHRIIGSINHETDLDRPEVIAALQAKARLEHFLNEWLQADDTSRFEMALYSRGVF